MKLLPVSTLLHCTHHNIFSCHEGKLIHYTGMDYLIIDNQSVTYIEQNSQNGIHSQEGFRYRDPTVGTVVQGALKPLGSGCKGRIQGIDHHIPGQGSNPLAAHGIALIGHSRRTDLMLFKRLFHLLEVLQNTHIIGKLHGALCNSRQGAQYKIVNLPAVGLAGNRYYLLKTQLLRNGFLHSLDFGGIPVKQFHKTGLGSGSTLAAPECQILQTVLHFQIIHVELVDPQSCALAHCGQLGRLQMGVGQCRHILVLPGKICQQRNDIEQLAPDYLQTFLHHQNIGIIAHITAGSAQMDNSLGIRTLYAIGIYMAHYIMPDFLFPGNGNIIVDIVLVCFQLVNLLLGDRQSLSLLRLGQSNPEPAPSPELIVLGEDILHLLTGITCLKGADVSIVLHNSPLLLQRFIVQTDLYFPPTAGQPDSFR